MKLCQECIKYMPDDALTCLSCGGGSWGVVEPDVCSQVPAVIVDDEPAAPEALSCGGGSWGVVEPDVCSQVPAVIVDDEPAAPEALEAPATTSAPAIVRTRGKK